MTEVVRKRVVVHGRVHGVFYRDTCRREAAARSVAGWVRNVPDGTVEAVFEGPPGDVEALVAWAYHGSHAAVVSRVDVHNDPAEGVTGFEVR